MPRPETPEWPPGAEGILIFKKIESAQPRNYSLTSVFFLFIIIILDSRPMTAAPWPKESLISFTNCI